MSFLKAPVLTAALLASIASSIALSAYAGQSERLNINTATAEQIDKTLVFVGEKTAQSIVEYRNQYGQFKSLDDLARVKGVSKRLVRYNRSRMSFQ